MKLPRIKRLLALALCTLPGLALAHSAAATDPLPSWNDGATKTAILEFVERVTQEGSPEFVPPEKRIATLDNDGTLWSEQPMYFQVYFALDRIREMAKDHPEWKTTEPFKSAVEGDVKGLLAQGMENALKVLVTSQSGVTAEEFNRSAMAWLDTAKHPETGMLFTQMVFQPMLELMDYLRANDFKVFIVTGGGIDFVRAFSYKTYGVPPEQVVGSSLEASLEIRDGVPVVVKEPKIALVNDKTGKPIGIYQHIGLRPIFAAGNSDGDLQMLEYTTIPRGSSDKSARFGLIVHHTDAKREWAYDRESKIGTLNKALDDAPERGWTVVDMKNDWAVIYPGSGK